MHESTTKLQGAAPAPGEERIPADFGRKDELSWQARNRRTTSAGETAL